MRRFLVIKYTEKCYRHKSFKDFNAALQACNSLPDFPGNLICVYDLVSCSFLEVEGHPKEFITPEIDSIIGMYENEKCS